MIQGRRKRVVSGSYVGVVEEAVAEELEIFCRAEGITDELDDGIHGDDVPMLSKLCLTCHWLLPILLSIV